MTRAPQPLLTARAYVIREFGVPANAVGIVGDRNHVGGYHCGEDRVVRGDYSVVESSRDRRGLSDDAAAIDIGTFSRVIDGQRRDLRHFSRWLVAQCEAGTDDTKDIREVIYSPDGRTVRRWDRLGRRSTGDSSHLWHTHISYFRDSTSRDKTALFRRYIEGDDMPSAEEIAEAVWSHRLTKPRNADYSHAETWQAETVSTSAVNQGIGAYNNTKEILAGQAAILAKLGGEDVADAVRAELARAADAERAERAREREELIAALTGQAADMAEAIADALPDNVDVSALATALGAELGRRMAS